MFVSGKKKQNTMKATVIADHKGRTLWTDALRPGRMHDVTAARNEGISSCFQHFPDVEILLDGWKQLIRWTHRRDNLPDTYQAIAASYRTEPRPPEPQPSNKPPRLTRYHAPTR